MMVSQPAVHLRPSVVSSQPVPFSVRLSSAHTDEESDDLGVAHGCNSVWANKHCSAGCTSDDAMKIGSSGFRVPPHPVFNLSNVTSVTANHTGECLVYPGMPSSHGASHDQSEDAQTWEHQNFPSQVPRIDLELDALPIHLVPPPPAPQTHTRCPGFWKCIVRLHRRFGQRIARQQVERGLKLYSEQKHEDAVSKWKGALRRINKQSDKFSILGYLCKAHAEWGGYRELIDFAFQQLDIANEIDSNSMRAQAYLNLSIGNENLSQFEKSITYCEHALQNLTGENDPKTLCGVYLDLSKAHLGLSNFSKSIEYLDLAIKIAREIHDPVLELQCYSGFGVIFTMLKDFDKGFQFHSRAHELAKSCSSGDFNAMIYRQTLLNLTNPVRKLGRLTDAVSYCEDAMKRAIEMGDIPSQAYCLCSYADILKSKNNYVKALTRYEASMKLMSIIDDVYGQCTVLVGMAKTLMLMKKIQKICDCKALEANSLALDYATQIGNKFMMYQCHANMEDVYKNLGDVDSERKERTMSQSLLSEMNLFCGVCHKNYGISPGKIEALPCSHIFHSRCVREQSKKQTNISSSTHLKKRVCPECRKSVMSKNLWMSTSSDDIGTAMSHSGHSDLTASGNKVTGIPV
ncbi:Uncharacterised protein g1126 [Pycnogonum litorale]